MLQLKYVHHIAIIASNYALSKAFYCDILGFRLCNEVWREDRKSWKGDLTLHGDYTLELFSFPDAPTRLTQPEACGLRHLAFAVDDIEHAVELLHIQGVICEPVRTDTITGKRFTFFFDPDHLPLELYQI